MKQLSIEPHFLVPASNEVAAKSFSKKAQPADVIKTLRKLPFNQALDLLRRIALHLVEKNEAEEAIKYFKKLDEILAPAESDISDLDPVDMNLHEALLQLIAATEIEAGQSEEAIVTAALLLNVLAQNPKRKDEAFLVVLASLLYDIAYIHNERGQYKQAERELEKSMKLFERLAKTSPERYGAAHILAQNASTQVYRSRVKQVNMLAHNQVATSTYLDMMNSGIEGAADRLIESLVTEGRTLAQMGRYREAVQYFSRALKYLTKIEPEFTERQLELSIDLGEALLNVNVSRDKGIHLLNTMLHKATKLNADEAHRRIVDILLNAKSRRLDILSIWHKVFPR